MRAHLAATVRSIERFSTGEFSEQRMFFTADNAARIAGAWDSIRQWDDNRWLSVSERSHLLASLIDSADACANTAGTYYAYLKTWYRKALRPFSLELLEVPVGLPAGQAKRGDALDTLRGHQFDPTDRSI